MRVIRAYFAAGWSVVALIAFIISIPPVLFNLISKLWRKFYALYIEDIPKGRSYA
jgi:hypothetical protein